MEEAEQLGTTTSLHTNEKNPNDIGMAEIAERRRSSTTFLPDFLLRETSSLSRTQLISNDRNVVDGVLTARVTMTAEEPQQQQQQHLRQERRRNRTEEDDTFPSWISNDSASLSSDDSPIVPIRLHERSLLDREMVDDKLSHRVWEDVKRRLHLLNVYLGIDTDEDESYGYLFDDHSDNEDHSSYAASDRTATTEAFSMESSVHSDDFEYGDDDSRIIRRIPS
ncbi:hypothetical protein IV203_019144 [Nitzschia inconspicua]|uniref:Uncharacterized protein n=1 Tax=Nitzschia inconspicua TaxID=303405 RepID=A0A9K3Q6W4_9STRA|nr:hypothetical protein IV203_019144 [Nitzschia inconspicua]